MNKMIFVGGFPAAGKSTFATLLSERLKIPVFHKDIIREKMADGFGSENIDLLNTGKKGSIATMHLMHHIAEQFMRTGAACIMDSNFSVLYPHFAKVDFEALLLLAEEFIYSRKTTFANI